MVQSSPSKRAASAKAIAKNREGAQSTPPRREELLKAAREAFIAHGISGASMRHIATAAGVDPVILYRHFGSKQALFDAAVIEPLEALAAQLFNEGAALAASTPDAKAAHVRLGVEAILRATATAGPLIATALFSDQEFGRRLYKQRLAPLFEQIAETAAVDLEEWADPSRDLAVLVPGVFMMCFGIAMDAHFRGVDFDVDSAANVVGQFVSLGISAQYSKIQAC